MESAGACSRRLAGWFAAPVLLALCPVPGGQAIAQTVTEFGVSARYLFDEGADRDLAELEFRPALEWANDRNLLRMSARFRLPSNTALYGDPATDRDYDRASRPADLGGSLAGELREAYWTFGGDAWSLSLGKRLVNWGRLDGYKILDALNPQDFREYILEDFDESRISTWSAGFRYVGRNWDWELFWSPDRTSHDLADPGSAFVLSAERFPLDRLASDVRRVEPGRDTVGLQLSKRYEQWDWRLVYIDGFDFEPIIAGDGAAMLLQHPRRRVFGGSIEATAGRIVVRAEATYRPDRRLNRPGEAAEVDQASVAVGLDYAGPWDVGANVQLIREEILDAPADLLRPQNDTITTLALRRSFQNDALMPSARWYQSLSDNDGLLRLKLDYALRRGGTLSIGADRFFGDENGLFGQFRDRERYYFAWRHTF